MILPFNLYNRIFEHLQIKDRLSICLVSSVFSILINKLKYTERVIFVRSPIRVSFRLTSVEIKSNDILNLKFIQNLVELEELYLVDYHNDVELSLIQGLTNLKRLKLNKHLNVNDLKYVNIQNLTHLDFSFNSTLNDHDLIKLNQLKNLKYLCLTRCCNISSNICSHLELFPKLKEVNFPHDFFNRIFFNDNDLKNIGRIKSLVRLHLKNCRNVSFNGLIHLLRLNNLKLLSIHDCPELDHRFLSRINSLKNLKYLYLHKCNNLNKGLIHLNELSTLKRLWINDCKITSSGEDVLKKLKSEKNCKIMINTIDHDCFKYIW
jgi:hypothetical protein